jgi:membrane-associated protease RseP (regulator of RpoE activity)
MLSKTLALFAVLTLFTGMAIAQEVEKEITVTIDEDSGSMMKIIVIEDGESQEINIGGEDFNWHGDMSNCMTGIMEAPDHGFLGVQLDDLNDQLKDYFEVDSGVLIEEITADSAAEKAGLKAGDVILKIEDTEVANASDVIAFMKETKPEDEIKVHFKRKGKNKSKKVTLDKAPEVDHKMIMKKVMSGDMGDFGVMEDIQMMFKGDGGPHGFHGFDGATTPPHRGKMKEELDTIKAQIEELRKEVEELKK